MCYCLPIVCSCESEPQKITAPEGMPQPIENVICPRCGYKGNASYMRHRNYCTLCFCLSCPCGHSEPYLACTSCHYNYSSSQIQRCNTCHVGSTFVSQYCPECGNKK